MAGVHTGRPTAGGAAARADAGAEARPHRGLRTVREVRGARPLLCLLAETAEAKRDGGGGLCAARHRAVGRGTRIIRPAACGAATAGRRPSYLANPEVLSS